MWQWDSGLEHRFLFSYLCTLTFFRGSIHMVWKKYIFSPLNRMLSVERKTFSQQDSRNKTRITPLVKLCVANMFLSYALSAFTVLKVYRQIRKSRRRRGRTIPQEYASGSHAIVRTFIPVINCTGASLPCFSTWFRFASWNLDAP